MTYWAIQSSRNIFFFSRTRLTCHLTRAASTPTSARRSNSHSDVAQASHAFSVPPASCRRKRETIAQERSNHSPIRLPTMPLPSGTLAARYTQTRRARPVALRTARRRPNSQPRRLRYDAKMRIAGRRRTTDYMDVHKFCDIPMLQNLFVTVPDLPSSARLSGDSTANQRATSA